MLSNRQNRLIENAVIKIYESLYDKAVKESKSDDKTDDSVLADLDEKIDIILDALGLKQDKKETEKETTVTLEEDSEENNNDDDDDIIDKEDIELDKLQDREGI